MARFSDEDRRSKLTCGLWFLCGVVLLASAAAMSLYSARLSPEQPTADRPLHIFVILYGLSCAAFVGSYRLTMRPSAVAPLRWIVGVAVLARLAFLPSELIESDDCYRYILDGQSLLAGINPYSLTPLEVQADPPLELIADHAFAARQVIARVNNPHVATLYPPLTQAAFAAGAAIAPWSIIGQRVIFMLCDLATMGLLMALLSRLGKPAAWVVVYAWNPLVIKEISNTAHADSLVGLWLVVLMALLTANTADSDDSRGRLSHMHGRHGRGTRFMWAGLVGLAAGAAIVSKLYPVLLLPCCMAGVGAKSKRVWAALLVVLVTGCIVAACYWPFMGIGFERLTAGMRTYAAHWINNAGAFALLRSLFDSPRPISVLLPIAVALIASMRVWRSGGRADELIRAVQATLLTWLLFAPACFPWYAVGLIAISVLRPRGWVVILTGALGLAYLSDYWEHQTAPESWRVAVRVVEHGAIWVGLAGQWVYDLRGRRDV